MNKYTQIKKTISLILIVTFLSTNSAYALPIKRENTLRPPLQTAPGNVAEQRKLLNKDSGNGVFSEEQKKEILEEIQKYCMPKIQKAKASLDEIYKSNLITTKNQEALFIILKEIPRYAKDSTWEAYYSLVNLLEPGLITQTNQKQVFTILKEIPLYAKDFTGVVYYNLANLLESGLITETNQKQVLGDFANILEEIFKYAGSSIWLINNSLFNLLKSGLITKTNQRQIFDILKEIPQYAEDLTYVAYDNLNNLLKLNLITEANQEQVLRDFSNILKEIHEYGGKYKSVVYDSLTNLLKSGLITETNQEQILKDFLNILKEIFQYAGKNAPQVYNRLANLLKLDLITESNQEQIFSIIKEIPQYEKGGTFQTFQSLINLLEALKEKQINLTDYDVNIIINMIKEQGDVSVTLNVIKELVLEFKTPGKGRGPAYGNSLSAMLMNSMQLYAPANEYQGAPTLASNETVFNSSQKSVDGLGLLLAEAGRVQTPLTGFSEEQKKEILKEVQIYCRTNMQEVEESLQEIYKSNLVTSQNQEALFSILKGIPQHAEGFTLFAYYNLTKLLKLGLITKDNQEQIFSILKEIPQYAGSSTWEAYDSLTNLLKTGLITKDNQKQIFSILKEISQYAKGSTQVAYDNLTNILIGKESSWATYDSLTNLLKLGLITKDNQEQILRDFSIIIKEIPKYAGRFTWAAYSNLNDLLKSGLITEINQEQIFAILKEIPKHAGEETPQALDSLISLLEALKQKQITLTENDVTVIINMIKTQGDVSATLNVIRDLVMEVKDPEEGQGLGNSRTLSSLINIKLEELGSVKDGKALEKMYAEIYEEVLSNTIGKGSSLETYNFGIELEQLSLRRTLVLKLGGKTSPSISDIRTNPVIKELAERRILLTPYIVAQIKLDKVKKYLDELESQIKQFGSRVTSIQPERLTELEKTIFYNYLYRQYPSIMSRVGFSGFEKNSLIGYIQASLRGDEFYISDSDIKDMIDLGLTIDEKIRRYVAKKHPEDDLWITSFREQVKLHTEFIRWYLSSVKPGGVEIKHTLEYFILSSLSIYGGMFGEEIDEFKHILDESINKHFDIFTKLSLGDKSLVRVDIPSIIDRLLYESFSTLDKEKDPDLLWKVRPYQRAYYSLLRCVETGEPGLFVLSGNTHEAFREALKKVSSDARGEVFEIPMSYFSERSDLFCMNVPDEHGNPEFLLGAIPRLIERAKANPDVPIYLVMDNIEAVQGSLRVELNPILWEKSIVISEINKGTVAKSRFSGIESIRDTILDPNNKNGIWEEVSPTEVRLKPNTDLKEETVREIAKGDFDKVWAILQQSHKRFNLPKNMHIMFTMDESGELHDEAFLNRVLRQRIGGLDKDDLKSLLAAKHQINKAWAEKLSSLYIKLNEESWKEKNVEFSAQDFINISSYAKKRGSDDEFLKEEAYRYLILKFRYESDRKRFSALFEGSFGAIPKNYRYSRIEIKDNLLIADGVQMRVSEEFAGYIKNNPGKAFSKIVLQEYGYAVRQMDNRLISQLVRQAVFKGESVSRVTVLEGVSGEGKTQLCQVISRIMGYKNLGFTIHKRSSLEEFRGGVFPGKDGLVTENDTPFLKAEREGGYLINFSELNTSYKGALFYWLYPEFSNGSTRLLPEIPAPFSREEPFYSNPISSDNLYVVDINPDDYRARERIPQQMRNPSTSFWMGYDYSEEDIGYQGSVKEEIEELIKGLFEIHFSSITSKEMDRYSNILSELYYSIQKDLSNGKIRSLYQVLTLRDIIRTIKIFRYYHDEKGEDHELAFRNAVKTCLWLMWQEKEPSEKIKIRLEEMGLWREELEIKDVIKDILASDIGHLIIHSNAVGDGYDAIKEILPKSGKVHYMSVNDFMELESLSGGVSVDLDGNLGVFPGALLKIIEEAEVNPNREHFFILDNFHQLNPDTAVGLNKALQEGKIELSPSVASIYKGRLVEGRFALIPGNLKIIALTYITKDPSYDDKLPMSGAELSRLVSIAMPGSMTDKWLEDYLEDGLNKLGIDKKLASKVISQAKDILEAYREEYEKGNHSQLRLSKVDLDEYLIEILKNKDRLNPEAIEEIAYYTIGMGLSDQAREPFRPRSPPQINYAQKEDGIYLKSGSVEYKTNYPDMDSIKSQAFLSPVDEILEVYQAALSGFEEGRRVILLEGPPGGGKTAIAEDIAKRLNLRFKKVSMHADIDLWEFLGKIEKIGFNKFRITCTKEEGRFLSEFLDFIENGGIYCFDEANISKASVEAISFLTQIIRGEPVDLGIYHNGVSIEDHAIKIHPDFKIFIPINPWETTKDRKETPLEIMWLAKKIHVTDNWKEESYKKLIDYYLKDKGAVSEEDKVSLIRLHIFMKYIMDSDFKDSYKGDIPKDVKEFTFSKFNELYTYQYGVSPRELIRIIDMVNNKRSLFEAILLNYLFQFSAASDLNAAVDIIETVFPGFKEFFDKWQKERVVYFGEKRIELSESNYKGFFMPVSSQVASLKALSLSVSSGGQHTLIISEQGSYPLELIKFFSEVTGSELYIFDANPFVNSVELLGGQMMKFGDLNSEGIAKSADRLERVMGFIGTHLVREDEYDEAMAKDKPMKILYLSSIEMVPGEELELLNDFLNTGRINIGGQNYVLPKNVRIVVETSVLREKRFSSPFYNRFQKIGLSGIAVKNEVFSYLDKYYPGMTLEEKTLIYGAAKLAWYLDMGRYDSDSNREHKKFTYRYGFSMKDVYKLAELVYLDKMSQKQDGQIDSVKTILRCILKLYGNDLDDASSKGRYSDRRLYFDALFEEVFDYEGIDETTLKELEPQLRDVKREWVSVKISVKDLDKGITLKNGLSVEREGEDIVINTAINKYRTNKEALRSEVEFSPGLKAKLEKDTLILSIYLVKSIGGMDSGMDSSYSLPPEEVPRGDYISYEGAINEVVSAIFWASHRVEDGAGRVRAPLPIILMGKTGGAKSTLVRNLSQVTGMPLYTLHCYENMEIDAFFAGMGTFQEGKERRVLLYLKEFFSHLGKINGEYYYPEGKSSHSLRKMLFLDEANVSPYVLYCLKPLFRGERKFDFYLFGEHFEVELDPEVILILAGNPKETYAARKNFSWEIIEDGLRIWVPALHTYLESERVKKEDLVAILFGMHKRKMKELGASTEDSGAYSIEREKMRDNSCGIIKLEKPEVKSYKAYKKREGGYGSREKAMEKAPPANIRRDIYFGYSIQRIEENLRRIGSISDKTAKYQYFLDNILRDYLLALCAGAAGIIGYKDGNRASLTFRVLEIARSFDEDFFKGLENIVYSRLSASSTQLEESLLQLRKIVLKNNSVNRFIFSFPFTKKGKLHILVEAEEIKDRILLGKEELVKLGIDIDKYEDKMPLGSHVVNKHPFKEEGKARGVFKGENYALVYESSTLAHSTNIPRDILLSWVGYHELGHLVDHLRVIGEEITPHPNVELFSVLFPIIFSKDNKGYIEKELLHLLKITKDPKSYYCQAAKGIFNGLLRILKEENPEDSSLKEIGEITDSFEDDSISAVYNRMIALDEETISNMGIKLYKDAWEKKFKGEYYLSTAKKGKYIGESGGVVRGDVISEFTEGIADSPDVEIQEGSQEEIEQNIEIESDAEEKEDLPDVEFDEEGKGKGKGEKGETSEEGVVIDEGWLETYYQKLGSFAKKFIDRFASEPKHEEVHTASGRKLDIRKWITLAQKVFKKSILEESTPSLDMSVTVDISGSISSRPNLVKAFNGMTKFFESLLYIAGKNASGVKFSLSAIGEEFYEIFGFDKCKNEDVLRNSIQTLWQQNDFGGINTVNLVEGLRMQYGQCVIQSENRIHIVLTDGDETSKRSFRELRKMVDSFEKEYNVDVIFVGIKTKDVTNYGRYLLLDKEPDDKQLMAILLKIAEEKVRRRTLPIGDLGKELGLEDIALKPKRGDGNKTYSPQRLSSLASNETVSVLLEKTSESEGFTKDQLREILKEIEKNSLSRTKEAKESLEELHRSGLVTRENQEALFTILKEICLHGGRFCIDMAYNSLINLLKSGLITQTNQEQILRDFLSIVIELRESGSGTDMSDAYSSLINLLGSGLITQANQKQVFIILREIIPYATYYTSKAYNSISSLLKLSFIKEVDQEQIVKDFSGILKEISQYTGVQRGNTYDNLNSLLESGLITKTNREQIFTILKEIPQYVKNSTYMACLSLTELLQSGLITESNEEEVLRDFSDILKEIPQYAGSNTWGAYCSLTDLLESNLITQTNQEQIFSILKEIPQYAGTKTSQALDSFISLLEALKQKQITLTQNDVNVIINMIRTQGDVSATLNVIKELVMEAKAPEEGQDPGYPRTLSAMLLDSMQIYAPANETQGALTLASNETVFTPLEKPDGFKGFTEDQKEEILKKIQKHCNPKIEEAEKSLQKIYNSGLITSQNQEAFFGILKVIPQIAEDFTHELYDNLTNLFKLGLITQTNQEQILNNFSNIYLLVNMLNSGLITEANQEQIFSILKEIPRYAKSETYDALQSFIILLETLKQKQITLSENDVTVIINMIKEQGDVSATLNVITDLVLEFKAPEEGQGSNNTRTLSAMLQGVMTLASNETVFTTLEKTAVFNPAGELFSPLTGFSEEQEKEILEEIRKYCSYKTQETEVSLQEIYKLGFVTPENQEVFFSTLKGIPKYAKYSTYEAYNSLTNLLKSGPIIQANQEQILAILKEIPQYAKDTTYIAYDKLTNLLKSGLITEANQEQIFTFLKEVPKYADYYTWSAYDIFTNLLKLGIVTESNQEQIFTIIKEIPQYAKDYTNEAYNTLANLYKLGLITQTNQEQVFSILKEIPQFAGDSISLAYNILANLLKPGLITETTQKQIFTIFKEIPQHAKKETRQAFQSLINLLEVLKQKQITLSDYDLNIIINMIKTQGDVSATLTVIKDFVSEFKASKEDRGLGQSMTLSEMLLNFAPKDVLTYEHQEATTLASNEAVFTPLEKADDFKKFNEEQKKEVLKEIWKYCSSEIQKVEEALEEIYELDLVTIQNQEALFAIFKEIPQYAGKDARYAYNSLAALLELTIITESNYEKILKYFAVILKEIPQHAEGDKGGAYRSLTALLKLNLITETNYEKILKDFLGILKEISKYAIISRVFVYNRLAGLFQSRLITATNQVDIFSILKEIPQYAGESTLEAYSSFINLLELTSITGVNQKQTFSITKEILLYAKKRIPRAFKSFVRLVEALKEKQITLTQNELNIIINMIKEQGDVSATLDTIKDLVLEFRTPYEGQDPGYPRTLSAMLMNSMQLYTPVDETQGAPTLASNETLLSKKQIKNILKERLQNVELSTEGPFNSGLITSQDKGALSPSLEDILNLTKSHRSDI